jgi:hypothetical protein
LTTVADFSVAQVGHYGQLYSVGTQEFVFVGQRGHANTATDVKALYYKWHRTNGITVQATEEPTLDSVLPADYLTHPTTALVGDTAVLVSNFVWGGRTSIQVKTYHPETSWGPTFTWQEGSYSSATNGVGNEFMRSGGNLNRPTTRMHLITAHSANDFAGTPNRAHYWWTNSAPLAPTTVSPGTNADGLVRVSSDRPTLRARSAAYPRFNRRYRASFQIDQLANWVTPSRTVTEPRADLQYGGVEHSEQVPGSAELFQGTWYMRASLIDEWGRQGIWTVGDTGFIVYHPPTSSAHTPSANAFIPYGTGTITVGWEFVDPSLYDFQTAYQVIVTDGTNVIYDSGKVVSAAQTHGVPLAVGQKDVGLYWYVTLWDSDDVAGPASVLNPFRVGDAPTVTITSPADGSTTDNPGVNLNWTVAFGGTRTFNAYMVTAESLTHSWSSGWVSVNETSFVFPETILQNDSTYTISVFVRDSEGLQGTDSITIDTEWIPPDAPFFSVDTDSFDTDGYITISWSHAAADPTFASYRVYRRHPTIEDVDPDWTLFAEISDVLTTYSVTDWHLGSNEIYEYVVVQVATRFGVPVESVKAPEQVLAVNSNYWLIVDDPEGTYGVLIGHVISDDPTEEQDYFLHNIIGRGRTEDRGTRWGWTGTLTAQLWDTETTRARDSRQELMAVRHEGMPVYLRNPFGDVYRVSMGNFSISRVAGTGSQEYINLTIPYSEISDATE